MALSIAYPRARYAAAVLVAGLAFGLSSVAFASEVFPSGARLRFSTTGVPVWTSPVASAASTSGSGGAVLLRATQSLNIGGVSVPIALSRNVPVANVARVLSVASRFMGPLAVAGLVYEGVRYFDDRWESQQGGVDPGTYYGTCLGDGSYPSSHTTLGGICTYSSYDWVTYYPNSAVPSGWTGVNNVPCSSYPNLCGGVTTGYGGIGRRVASESRCADGSPKSIAGTCAEWVVASDEDLEISFQQGLIQAPTLGPTLLDLALRDSRARAALLAEAMQLDGPATAQGPSTTTTEVAPGGQTTINRSVTYNLNFAGDVVTVTETVQDTRTDPSNNVTITTTTTNVENTSEPQAVAPSEDIECGLPGMPKCAIDETGTPDGSGTDQAGFDAIDQGGGAIEDGITGIADAPITDLGMGLDVDLPAGNCSPLTLTYKSWSKSTNWCPVLGVARDIWGWFIGILGALYVFRRATNPMA